MTERGRALHAIADGQIAELIALISTVDEAALRLPCPGRERLGDGTVGASVRHTADNYQRIADFVQTSDRMSGAHRFPGKGAIASLGSSARSARGPTDHAGHGPGAGQQEDQYTADTVDLTAVTRHLSASRDALGQIAELTYSQLDATPPRERFRFCDGQRTLEQVLASLLKHQSHQVDALKTALA